ncbi:MAG: hypothetical protein H0X65_08190 [Gemmatimonadetes bacterium]|nr:hypothetical protein [Gemmatimonadota bacterium]
MDWPRWEQTWYAESSRHLQPHISLATDVHDFVEFIATHEQVVMPERTHARFVERLLLRRLGEEYRTVELLAVAGHGFQAMTACANLFELAHTLGHVAGDETAAATWLASDDANRTPWNIKKLVTEKGRKLAWNQARIDDEYSKYRLLCGFKHNNPVAARFLRFPGDPDLILAQFAIAEGAHLTLIATSSVALLRLHGQSCVQALEVANGLLDRVSGVMPSISGIVH